MEFNKGYNREEFLQFLRVNFLPEDFFEQNNEVTLRTQTRYTQSVVKLGVCKSLDLVVYEVKHNGKEDPRVGLSKEAFRLLADEWESRALVLFIPIDSDANYRFSLINIDLKEGSKGKTIKEYSNPRRYSYYLGDGIGGYTPNKYLFEKGRVATSKDLQERFSTEVLTKAFYQELSDWYAWAINIVKFPNDIDDDTDDTKYNTESVIRLITRLIFVWFLKQRKLVPDEFFDQDYISNKLLKDFNPHFQTGLFYEKSNESKYYKAILQNLFFAMLNSPITPEGKDTVSERRFKRDRGGFDNNKLMRYYDKFSNPDLFLNLANDVVPFLNGGLFECLDDKQNKMYIDGFSDREIVQEHLVIPDYLFFGEEVGKDIDLSEFYGDKKKKKVSARGIIDILKRYNFTVEENTPFDQEVSLDPELLGKVFENLLASFNPETKTTARKQTGSFYTPREIVQYMVDESLVAHLKRTVGGELEEEYRKLMRYTDEELTLTPEQKKAIMHSLYECKILDPACGSGAFPMGVLQQMVHILSQLDPENTEWKDILIQGAIDETTEAYRNASTDERAEAIADIERSFNDNLNRPDYARKLYLIERCIFGVDIQPIAIQISKLRFFISLIVDQKANNNPIDNFGIRPLPNLEAKFVAANTLIGLNKKDITLFDTVEIKEKENKLKEAKHKIFGAKTSRTKNKWKARVAELRTEIAEALKGADAVGNIEAQQFAKWDMFDQNATSPFFDPEWMFGVNEGFDIVIGNPPYIIVKDSNTDRKTLSTYKKYRTADFKINLFALFFERAINLSITNGIQSFIIPDSSLNLSSFKKFREFIMNNGSLICVSMYNENVFENATVGKSVIITAIKKYKNKDFKYRIFNDKINYLEKIVDIRNILNDVDLKFIEISNSEELSLINNIRANSFVLSYYCDIYDGINPGSEELKHIFFSDKNINKYSKQVIDGKDFERFTPVYWSGKYVYYNEEFVKSIKLQYIKESKQFTARIIKKVNFFNSLKIITRQTADCIIATIDNENYFTKNSVHSTLIKEKYKNEINILCLLAILNSSLINWLYKYESNENGRVFPQVKIDRLRNLPIANISGNKHPIIDLVDKILEVKKLNQKADTSALEAEIDLLVYKLYNLTYDEVLIIDPSITITKEEYEE